MLNEIMVSESTMLRSFSFSVCFTEGSALLHSFARGSVNVPPFLDGPLGSCRLCCSLAHDRDGSGADLIVSALACLRKHLVLSCHVTGMESLKP